MSLSAVLETWHSKRQRMPSICEDCKRTGLRKMANFGLAAELRRRWCAGCARARGPTVVDVTSRKCADCRRLNHHLKKGTSLSLSNPL